MTLLLEAGVPHCPLFRSTRIGGRVAYWHKADMPTCLRLVGGKADMPLSVQAITRWVNMEMTTMTLKVQYLTKLEEGTQIPAGWYVTTPFCPGVVFATEQEALAYGRTEELRQELMDRVRAMTFDELRA